jgi:hypothetical protein
MDSVVNLGNVDDLDSPGSLFSEDAKAGIAYAAKARTTSGPTSTARPADLQHPAAVQRHARAGVPASQRQFPIANLFAQAPADGPVVRDYRTTSGSAAVGSQEALSGMTPTAILANPATVVTIRKSKAGFPHPCTHMESHGVPPRKVSRYWFELSCHQQSRQDAEPPRQKMPGRSCLRSRFVRGAAFQRSPAPLDSDPY